MKLYPNERRAIKIIGKFQMKGRSRFSLDDFAERFWATKEKTPWWRTTTVQLLRRVSNKLSEAGNGCRLTRLPPYTGRGNVARYEALGSFDRLLE